MTHWQRWLMRAILTVSLVLNAHTVFTADAPWLRMLGLSTILFVALCWGSAERAFRKADAFAETVWREAAEAEDPIGYMAGYSYLKSLSTRQMREIADTMPLLTDSAPFEDLPPSVQGYLIAVNAPPREP